MSASTQSAGLPSNIAERLFAEHVAQLERGEPVDFEAFCQAHPEHAQDLRRCHADWTNWLSVVERMSGLDAPPKAIGSLLDRLRRHTASADRFRVEGEVGRGGMGSVLRVWDEDLRRPLAMKVALPGERDMRTLGRFVEEAQITAQLDHPGIVPVHEAGVDQRGDVWFTMRLVHGDDLRVIYQRVADGQNGWTRTRALGVLLKVCEAMSYAHDRGVLHRDLKPANIMVGNYGEVYVMDWGLARVEGRPDLHDLALVEVPASAAAPVASSRADLRQQDRHATLLTRDGQVLGTPAYMAPEQAHGDKAATDRRADVYAVGAMLYHLLAGRAPYQVGHTTRPDHELLELLRQGPPAPVQHHSAEVSPELLAIVDRAMRRDPAQRYADMTELAADLRAYLEGRVVKAHQTGTWAETRKWVQRNRALAASLVGTMLALVTGLVVASRFAAEASNQAQRTAQLNTELLAQSRDLKLRGLLQDVARLRAATRNAELARALGVSAHQWWVNEAQHLVLGRADDGAGGWSPGLADVRRRLEEVRALALPYTDADRQQDFDTHPKRHQLPDRPSYPASPTPPFEYRMVLVQAQYRWQARMLGVEPWPDVQSVAGKLREQHLPEDFEGRLRALRAATSVRPDYRALDGRLMPVAAELVQQAQPDRRAAALSTQALVWARSARFAEALAALEEARALAVPAEAAQMERDARLIEAQAAAWDSSQRSAREYELDGLRVQLEEAQHALEAENARLRVLCDTRRTWRYSDSQTQWWHDQLVLLQSELELLDSLLQYAELTTRRPEAARLWAEVAADVAANPSYAGVQWHSGRLTPQLGLLPLGKCPQSGLWEFVHLQSGDAPSRKADGTWELRPEVGLIFVLIPGGRIPREEHVGGDLARQWAPLTEVDLSPFFLSKYEMTQAQWNRVSEWQGLHGNPDPLHPANFLSWQQCQATFTRCLGWIDLPTEAQWEYACRAGTTTAWWTGTTESSLEGAAQVDGLHDVAAEFVHMLPVGSLRPNPFGLHDMHGNVWEWCKDTYGGTGMRALDGDHSSDREGGADRIFRGGSYLNSPSFARAGFRFSYAPGRRLPTLGLRPAMAVLP